MEIPGTSRSHSAPTHGIRWLCRTPLAHFTRRITADLSRGAMMIGLSAIMKNGVFVREPA